MSYPTVKLKDISLIKTGKLDSNAAVADGVYPFFTCDPNTLRINDWAYDTEAVLLAGNNASGNYTAKYYKGKFNAYQRVYIIETADAKRLNIRYLCYAMNQQLLLLKTMSSGSTTKFLTLGMLHGLDIPLPVIEEQNSIVAILSAYDDLIENNQKQIKLLEEAAQRLYKEWFVDLRFPDHETTPTVDGVPEGWKRCQLEDVIVFNPKVTLNKERLKQSVPMSALSTTSMVLDFDQFTVTYSNAGTKFQNGDTLLARITPCLENGKTAFVSGIDSEEGAVGSTEYIVMRAKEIEPCMVYLLARTEDFRQSAINSMTGSDGRQRAQIDKLKGLPYLKPTIRVIDLFAKCVEPMFLQIQIKNKQVIELKQARDRLLPKLMNGEIEV